MLKQLFFGLLGLALWGTLNAATLEVLNGTPQQGSLIIARLTGEAEVYFEQRKLQQTKQGIVVFGVGRDAPKQVFVTLKSPEKEQKITIDVVQRAWNIEKIDGLPPTKVNPVAKSVLARIKKEGKLVRQARNQKSLAEYFTAPFIIPADGRISGVYGSQRVLNGQPKRPHFGLDIANKTGTPVVAPADGIVSLTYADMFYSGGTLIIDHGFGVSSTYIHLNSIDVEVGQQVKQGERIATIGSTGRATGPHLDWRLNWFQTRLDPQLLIDEKLITTDFK